MAERGSGAGGQRSTTKRGADSWQPREKPEPAAERGAEAGGRQLREELAAEREELQLAGGGLERNRRPREEPGPAVGGRAKSKQSVAKRSLRPTAERGAGAGSWQPREEPEPAAGSRERSLQLREELEPAGGGRERNRQPGVTASGQ